MAELKIHDPDLSWYARCRSTMAHHVT